MKSTENLLLRLAHEGYYQERLEDLALLEQAVFVEDDLAVPVGGKRRGGYICVSDHRAGTRAIKALKKHEGFPNLRFEPGGKDYMAGVYWGEPQPELPPEPDFDEEDFDEPEMYRNLVQHEIAAGRHYGYSDKVIRDFIVNRHCASLRDSLLAIEMALDALLPGAAGSERRQAVTPTASRVGSR